MTTEIKYNDKPWLHNYAEGVPGHLEFEQTYLPEYLERSARNCPHNTALLFQGYQISYRELNDMVNRFAAVLYDFGIKKGDRIAVLLPNIIPCVVSYYAVLKVGAIAVMNNPLYTDTELKHQFNDSGAKILITLDLLANRMIDLRPETGIKQIIYTSLGDYLPFPKNLLFRLIAKKKKLASDVKAAEAVFQWKKLIARNKLLPHRITLDPDDIAMLQYTGGTTGVPKGVMLTHGNLYKQIQQVVSWFPEFESVRHARNLSMLSALPFFHIFGVTAGMNFAVYMGWANILVPKPQPDSLLENIKKYRPTFAPLVPTMFIGMLNHPAFDKIDFSCLKGCFSGGAPLPIEVIKAFEEKTGAIIMEGFGMSESSAVTHINPYSRRKRKIGSIGLPIPDTDCRIVSLKDRRTDVPAEESGELLIRGPQVMKGYWNKPEETTYALRDGWLHTGDIAKMDVDGYFYIVDRIKDMIISGGYNVYPRDIDEVFYEHPKIKEACAIGIPHPARGEAIKVFAVLKENERATPDEMIEYCRAKLAPYKLPVEIEFRKQLPKSNVGKILRRELRIEEITKYQK